MRKRDKKIGVVSKRPHRCIKNLSFWLMIFHIFFSGSSMARRLLLQKNQRLHLFYFWRAKAEDDDVVIRFRGTINQSTV